MRFADRRDAGRRLTERLLHLRDQNPIVLALPRGGVPVGFEIAHGLEAPLDVVLVRKLGHPYSSEVAIGAMAEDRPPELTAEAAAAGLEGYLLQETALAAEEIARRRWLYRQGKALPSLTGMTAILVDDGIATGATMHAALGAARQKGPKRLVVAAPTAARDAAAGLSDEADEMVCLDQPSDFRAVGLYYADFRQIEDATVVDLLRRAGEKRW